MTTEQKTKLMQQVDKRAMNDIVNALKLHNINYFDLDLNTKSALISVYVSGAAMMYELPNEAEKGTHEQIDF